MWKLLIAEDEPTIRKGLRNAVYWEDYSISVIGEADDGEIALEMAIEERPNILFIDINMPFLNGLELIQQLRQHLPGAIFIVISGYDEFDYAQQAIKLEVFDYLLKPVNKTELEKTIKRATEQLDKNNRSEQRELQLEGNKPLLKEKFFQKWSLGKISREEVYQQVELLSIKLEGQLGMAAFNIAKELIDSGIEQHWSEGLISFSLNNLMKDVLKAYPNYEFFEDQNSNFILLIPTIDLEQFININREVKDYAEQLLGKVIIYEEIILQDPLDFPMEYKSLVEKLSKYKSLSPMVALAKDYIDQHYDEHSISLQHVANVVQVSPTYLSKQIKNELGVSFIHYLTNVRINKALLLIKDPYLKVYEIADLVGYSTQHYFCNAFKKVIGISPTDYRSGVKTYE